MRKQCLIIGLTLIALTALLAYVAYAETTISGTYTTSGKGYDMGFGVGIEHSQRLGNLELTGTAKASHRPKFDAEHGYTWGIASDAVYHWQLVYAGAGYNYSGYKSRFADGRVWAKKAHMPYVLAGYVWHDWDFSARYYVKESQTPNNTEHAALKVEYAGANPVIVSAGWGHSWFDQSGKRENEGTMTVGIGWRF